MLKEDLHRLVVNVLVLCAPCVSSHVQVDSEAWETLVWEPGESVTCNAVIVMVISQPTPLWLPKTDFVILSLGQEGCV